MAKRLRNKAQSVPRFAAFQRISCSVLCIQFLEQEHCQSFFDRSLHSMKYLRGTGILAFLRTYASLHIYTCKYFSIYVN